MTALLFIPTTADARLNRRLDFARIATLFAETDEPLPAPARGRVARIGLLVLILLGAIGDTLLVTRSDTMTTALSTVHATPRARIGVSS